MGADFPRSSPDRRQDSFPAIARNRRVGTEFRGWQGSPVEHLGDSGDGTGRRTPPDRKYRVSQTPDYG